MASLCSSNLTSGFIDLATYDEQEKYMYGGRAATAYFVRETRKSTWFTQVPVVLSKCSGSPAFGSEWSVQISRAGDYLLQTWLRVELPEVCITSDAPVDGSTLIGCCAVRWTRNLGHALIREACLTFNDLVAARFDNYHLDFWAAFTTPASTSVSSLVLVMCTRSQPLCLTFLCHSSTLVIVVLLCQPLLFRTMTCVFSSLSVV